MATDMLGLKPEECLIVEDTYASIEEATAGGFDCAAISDTKDDTRVVST